MIGKYGEFGFGEFLCDGLVFAYITKEQQHNPWLPNRFSTVSWEFSRSAKAIKSLRNEFGRIDYPSVYILMDTKASKVYVGEAQNVVEHMVAHTNMPNDKIKNWDRAIIINDGRNATQSDLNDENIRLILEDYLVKLFKINKYKTVTVATRSPSLSSPQKTLSLSFKEEIMILLSNKNKISKFLTERADAEVYLDDAKKILQRKGWSIQEWGEKYAVVNNLPTVIRPGSSKHKGWQVTFRGSTSLSGLKEGNGYLLMPRGKILLIPLKEIKDFLLEVDSDAFTRDTIDVFVRFDDDKIAFVYKDSEIIITHHSVQEYP